jgi:hypothetical protein
VGEEVRIELPIETERLVIRPLELADATDLGESEEWIREKIDRFERDGGMSLWAAVNRQSGRAVALAGLQWEQIDGRRELDLGCVVATHEQQRGYATEASEAIVSAAFAAGCERLTAMTGPENAAAWHVHAAAGDDLRGAAVRVLRAAALAFPRACPRAPLLSDRSRLERADAREGAVARRRRGGR